MVDLLWFLLRWLTPRHLSQLAASTNMASSPTGGQNFRRASRCVRLKTTQVRGQNSSLYWALLIHALQGVGYQVHSGKRLDSYPHPSAITKQLTLPSFEPLDPTVAANVLPEHSSPHPLLGKSLG